jgi:hypothetical protein
VAFDSKLWIWWDELEHATNRINAHERLALDVDSLEASYLAIRLMKQISILPNGHRVYEVNPESAECKIDDGDQYLAIGLGSEPGFPLQLVRTILPVGAASYSGPPWMLYSPLYSALRATLVRYDRNNSKAEVRIQDSDGGALISYLANHTALNFDQDIFLTESKPFFNQAKEATRPILAAIGNPSIATPDLNAAKAMAQPPAAPGKDPLTPAAEILWAAPSAYARNVINPQQGKSIAAYAAKIQSLNPSQVAAVERAAVKGLSIIWGPPGTGKTKTLVALVHALVRDAHDHHL